MTDWIVTRHPATREWLQERLGYDCIVRRRLTEYDLDQLGPGDRVFGVLPIPLVKRLYEAGVEVYLVISEDGGLYEWGPRLWRVEGLILSDGIILSDHTLPVGGGGGL